MFPLKRFRLTDGQTVTSYKQLIIEEKIDLLCTVLLLYLWALLQILGQNEFFSLKKVNPSIYIKTLVFKYLDLVISI